MLEGSGFAQAKPAAACLPIRPACCVSSPMQKDCANVFWWGSSSQRHVPVGGEDGYESPELDAQPTTRAANRCTCSSASRSKRIARLGRRRAPARAARLGQPQHLRARRRPRPRLLGRDARDQDQIGYIDANTRAIFGRSYAGEPDVLVKQLAADEAIAAADTLLLTVPNQLGVDYNAHAIVACLPACRPGAGLALT